MKNKKNSLPIIALLALGLVAVIIIFARPATGPSPEESLEAKKINGLMMLIEFEDMDGVWQWEKELDKRGLTALMDVQANMLREYPEDFKRLADKGYEIAGVSSGEPYWGVPYEKQYQDMLDTKNLVEEITGKKMRVFSSKYFAYDETTLQVADELGVEYLLGRGVNDVEATLYSPEEYEAKIISVTNVDVGEPMGRGSLCDYSLWARGASGQEFREILEESLAKEPDNMILVSHAYLGGTRLEWWNEYERVLSSDKVIWKGFSEWIDNQAEISLPIDEIPVNQEVKYTTPSPAKEISEYEAIPGLGEGSFTLPNEELMCL
ncbi:MAG: polysaccharide deacetylase family protein [Patescibacteria group bacterium]|jgi:hypothetical protein